MDHYDIDGLMQYECAELPSTTLVVNPTHRKLNVKIGEARHQLRKHEALLGKLEFDNSEDMNRRAEKHQDIQAQKKLLEELRIQRRKTPRKICINELPPGVRPQQLFPLAKTMTDCIRMIAYPSRNCVGRIIACTFTEHGRSTRTHSRTVRVGGRHRARWSRKNSDYKNTSYGQSFSWQVDLSLARWFNAWEIYSPGNRRSDDLSIGVTTKNDFFSLAKSA